MADPPTPNDIARRTFDVARRGYEQQEVRGFLHEVSAIVDRLTRAEQELRERAERAEAKLGANQEPDEALLLEILGEETTRVLTSSDAAGEIRAKAEAAAARIIAQATAEAADIRANAVRDSDALMAETQQESDATLEIARTELDRRRAEADEMAAHIIADGESAAQALRDEGQADLARARADGEAALAAARQEGRVMVAEAQAVRERVLRDLAVRRKRARQQVEKLAAGRERLLEAYDVVRRTVGEATDELATSLTDARLAADAAARRVDDEPEQTLAQLDEEVADAGLVDLPIAEIDVDDDTPGPFSGEVPAVDADMAPAATEGAPPVVRPAEGDERRGRKRRRRGFSEGLPAADLTVVQPTSEDEGVRILAETAADEPESADETVEAEATEPDDGPDALAIPEETIPAEVDEAAASEPQTSDETGGLPDAQTVFARLRAERGTEDIAEGDAAADEPQAEAATGGYAKGGEAPLGAPTAAAEEPQAEAATGGYAKGGEAPLDASATRPFAARSAALESVDKELARRLKRGLADEQNEVLDLLRRAKPNGVDDLLPGIDEHAARWAESVTESLAEATAAGADWSGGRASSVADLADELARSLTGPLRERIDRSFAASDGNLDDVADRVRALYREWKGKRLTETSSHFAAAAYARGVYDGVAPDALVRWVVDPAAGPCPDCNDNVLAGHLTKGSDFPTGNTCAPAHPGCHCLVLAADG